MKGQNQVLAAAVLAVSALSTAQAKGEAVNIDQRTAALVLDTAAAYQYQKSRGKTVGAACWFDPDVRGSTGCAWRFGGDVTNAFSINQRVKSSARKHCRKAGGKSCKLLWRNGKLSYENLARHSKERFKTTLASIKRGSGKGKAVPEGQEIGASFRVRFEDLKTGWEKYRKKRRGMKLHYALCANKDRTWASFSMEGRESFPESVAGMCVLKCNALAKWNSNNKRCYVVYTNGKFASKAARKAILGED